MSEGEELTTDYTNLVPVVASTWIATEPHPTYGTKNVVTVMFVTQPFISAKLGARSPTVIVGGLDCYLGAPLSVAYSVEEFFDLYTPLYGPWTVVQEPGVAAGAVGAPVDGK